MGKILPLVAQVYLIPPLLATLAYPAPQVAFGGSSVRGRTSHGYLPAPPSGPGGLPSGGVFISLPTENHDLAALHVGGAARVLELLGLGGRTDAAGGKAPLLASCSTITIIEHMTGSGRAYIDTKDVLSYYVTMWRPSRSSSTKLTGIVAARGPM
jgi:hypothetical protein